MSRKRYSPEQIIGILREVEVLLLQGTPRVEVCRHLGVSEQSYYRWRKEYGGLKVDQARQLCQTKSYQPQECVRPTISGSQLTPFSQSSEAPLFENVAAVEVTI